MKMKRKNDEIEKKERGGKWKKKGTEL